MSYLLLQMIEKTLNVGIQLILVSMVQYCPKT